MKIQNLDTLKFVSVNDRIQGSGWPYATATAAGVAEAGARASAYVVMPRAVVYSATSAAAGAAAGAATVNGLASVSVGVKISY